MTLKQIQYYMYSDPPPLTQGEVTRRLMLAGEKRVYSPSTDATRSGEGTPLYGSRGSAKSEFDFHTYTEYAPMRVCNIPALPSAYANV